MNPGRLRSRRRRLSHRQLRSRVESTRQPRIAKSKDRVSDLVIVLGIGPRKSVS